MGCFICKLGGRQRECKEIAIVYVFPVGEGAGRRRGGTTPATSSPPPSSPASTSAPQCSWTSWCPPSPLPPPPLPPSSESGSPSAPLTTSTGPLLRDWQPQRGSGAAAVSCGHTCGRSPSRPNILQLYILRLYVRFDSVPVTCDFSECCAVGGSKRGPRIHVSRSTPYGLRVSCTVSESIGCDRQIVNVHVVKHERHQTAYVA